MPIQKLTRAEGGQSGSSVLTEPFDHLIQHIKQYDPMLYEALKRVPSLIQNITDIQDIVDGIPSKSKYWKGFRAILPLVPPVLTDVMDNRYRVDIPDGKKIILGGVSATSKINPSIGDLSADVLVSIDASVTFSSIFNGTSRIKIANGAHRGDLTALAIRELNLDDELRIDVLSNGAASGIEIVGWGTLEDK